jgi:hypothetical protein
MQPHSPVWFSAPDSFCAFFARAVF